MSVETPIGLPEHITRDQLADLLHIGAAGDRCDEAAIGLLTRHGTWLERRDFRDCIQYWPAAIDDPLPTVATVAWCDLASGLDPATFSEQLILGIAASLASGAEVVNLRDALTCLGDADRQRVVDAIRHAAD